MPKGLRYWARLATVDISPLRNVPGYRWLFAGMLLNHVGRQLTVVAVPFQVFELTGSTLAVGLLGLAQLIPLLLVALVGGALADAVNRRNLLLWSQVSLAGTAAGLLWNSLGPQPELWPLFAFSAANAGISAIDSPARHSILPGLVGRKLLPASLALNQTLSNLAKAAVPAVAGLLIAYAGLAATYAVEGLVFLASALLIHGVPRIATEGGGRPFSLGSIAEGFRFLKSRRLIQAALLIDLNAMLFGMPTALFPAIGTGVLDRDAVTVGLLYAAPGFGALIAALTSGWVSLVVHQGRAVIVGVVAWGAAIAVFGLTSSLGIAVTMLSFAGAADVVSAIFRHSIVQLTVPDSLRGRLSSINMMATSGGPRLGDLEAGVVAAVTTVRFSVVSGGLACILGALALARLAPGFVRYRYFPDEPKGSPA